MKHPLAFLGLLVTCLLVKAEEETIDEVIAAALPNNTNGFYTDGDIVRVEMDILYRKEDYLKMLAEDMLPHSQRTKRKALRNTRLRWTNKQVVYSIRPNTFSSSDVGKINKGIAEWEGYTCLKFKKRTNERNYVYVSTGGGCSSFVGMIGGSQRLSLDRGCRRHATIVHEFGHAIGFHHEQTRTDRDRYVTIHEGNIRSKNVFNFRKKSASTLNNFGVPYDYRSVMHYGSHAFSKNGRATITTKDRAFQNIIGRAPGLSFRDIKAANLMYNCAERCAPKKCPGEGFLAQNCKCYCPGSPIKECDGSGPGPTRQPTKTPPTQSPPSGCSNNHERCQEWADRGECSKNPRYMLINCKKSCDVCPGGKNCKNDNSKCDYWASIGECKANPKYMRVFCRKACKEC